MLLPLGRTSSAGLLLLLKPLELLALPRGLERGGVLQAGAQVREEGRTHCAIHHAVVTRQGESSHLGDHGRAVLGDDAFAGSAHGEFRIRPFLIYYIKEFV